MFKIGKLQVDLNSRDIFLDGKRIQLGTRAFDILELLILKIGTLVTKDMLISHVWPNSAVEENNLQVHISTLRKLLGTERELIKTVPGRGYMLAAGRTTMPSGPAALKEEPTDAPNNLPALSSPLIGREVDIKQATVAMRGGRVVTLVGAGGIGKTRLAIAVASALVAEFCDGVFLVSLAAANDRNSVVEAFAIALGLKPANNPATAAAVVSGLANKRILLVVDNCEHVLPIVAELVETLLRIGPSVQILATSREALRLPGETVLDVAPLGFPASTDQEQDILRCSAVKLFLSRARAADVNFSTDAQSVALTGTVCRRLDGIPLAIEFAAARAAVLGIHTLAMHLDDRFRLLTGGHRTALPRHQTLKATLDWSYALLDKDEQVLLRRLGIFVGDFSLPGVLELMGEDFKEYRALNALSGLAAKSLLMRGADRNAQRYWLLETTRIYAIQKLEDHGEYRQTAFGHTRYVFSLMHRCEQGQSACEKNSHVDEIRACLQWAFSARGDEDVSINLSTSAAGYFFDASRVADCAEWSWRGLMAIASSTRADLYIDLRMRLLAAYAASRVFIYGPDQTARDIWAEVLSTATTLNDVEYKARALWGLFSTAQYAGATRIAAEYSQEFHTLAIASKNVPNIVLGELAEGISKHYGGYQADASVLLQQMLVRYEKTSHRLVSLGSRIDHSIIGRAILARVLWLHGKRETALKMIEQALLNARSDQHDVVLCYVLIEAAIPLALLSGKWATAKGYITMLSEVAEQAGLSIWQAYASCYREYWFAATEPDTDRLAAFRDALHAAENLGVHGHSGFLAGGYAMALARHGRVKEGIDVILEATTRSSYRGEQWYSSELRRLQGEILMANPTARKRAGDPYALFLTAFEDARRQGAASFQLRAAISIARLSRISGISREEIQSRLIPVCSMVSEGRAFDDYHAAATEFLGGEAILRAGKEQMQSLEICKDISLY